jgi:NTE family protein
VEYLLFMKSIPKLVLLFFIFLNLSGYSQNRPKVGLVLSGGGALGLAHIGVIKVMEEAGIKPDYIGGTSMGAIIAALYATNHNADSLIKIAEKLDWVGMFNNTYDRKRLSIREKEEQDRYMASIYAEGFKLQMPTGLTSGQNVNETLSNLFWPYLSVKDFGQLPIPFFCVATNLQSGEAHVFDHGSITDAVRASMSIPSLFTPVNIDSLWYIDGVASDNFPVGALKAKGMDVLIGVTLNPVKNDSKEEFKPANLAGVLFQTSFVHARSKRKKNEKLCNILITPDLQNYNEFSYKNTDSLIAIGERAARTHIAEFRALADRLRKFNDTVSSAKVQPLWEYNIEEVQVNGLKKVDRNIVMTMLDLHIPGKITRDEIKKGVKRIYSSQYFSKATFEIDSTNNKQILIITTEEKPPQLIQFGFHYDNDFKIGVLLNFTQHHALIKGARFSFDAIISGYQRYKMEYIISTGLLTKKSRNSPNFEYKPDIRLALSAHLLDPYVYDSVGKITANFHYIQDNVQLFFVNKRIRNLNIGLGAEYHHSNIGTNLVHDPVITWTSDQLNALSFVKYDNFDNRWFPTSGLRINAGADYHTDIVNAEKYYSNFFTYAVSAELAVKIFQRFSIIAGANTISVQGDSIPWDNRVLVGGVNNTSLDMNVVPFTGYSLMEITTKNTLVGKSDFQWNFYGHHYLIGTVSVGNVSPRYEDLFNNGDVLFGYGLTYAYKSILGPFQFTAMKAQDRDWKFFLSIGFWF